MQHPVVIGLSPNTDRKDYQTALAILFTPWQWQTGAAIGAVEEWFKARFNVDYAVPFNAGRSALFAILKSCSIGHGDEVLLQAFTCAAVPNSVFWSGAKPIYVDIDGTFNLDPADLEKKRTPRTRAVIVQHTFGIPAQMDKIVAFCKKHKLLLIEDCAHALGAVYKGQEVGAFGDVTFFSFGRDKVVSGVFGGMAITKNTKIGSNLVAFQKNLGQPSIFWVLQQLLHPILSAIILPTYNILSFGKALLFMAQKLKLLSFPVYAEEKRGKKPAIFPKRLPNALAALALTQLQKLADLNTKRREHAQTYFKLLDKMRLSLPPKNLSYTYLRFTVLTPRADEIRFQAKKEGMVLGDWYKHVIDPIATDLDALGYSWGSCPKAETSARETLNLPTYPALSESQQRRIAGVIDSVLTHE